VIIFSLSSPGLRVRIRGRPDRRDNGPRPVIIITIIINKRSTITIMIRRRMIACKAKQVETAQALPRWRGFADVNCPSLEMKSRGSREKQLSERNESVNRG
jgi:hypothetical protein